MDVHGAQMGEIKKKEDVIPSPLDSQELSQKFVNPSHTWEWVKLGYPKHVIVDTID